MTGPDPAWDPWTDQSYLRESQYKTDLNLAARQSIYAYQQPPVDLARETLELARLDGQETVTDVGCGNGRYLAELARRGHTGPVLGVDMSPGMLLAARNQAPAAGLLVADAMALPVRDAAAGLTLAMHMLYHVPEPEHAVRELRRITRPGGQVIVGLNGADHLRELRGLIAEALAGLGRPPVQPRERIGLDQGERLLSSRFTSVARHDFVSQLRVPDAEPIAAYVRSRVPDAGPLAEAVLGRLPADPARFPITTHSGCLVCS
jgi:SAM-dependent methyltransferase